MIPVLLAMLLAAPDVDAGLAALRAQDELVARVGYRLSTANAARCTRQMPASGLLLHGLEQYGAGYAARAKSFFALGDAPGVLGVIAGSPAATAGIRARDALIAINGQPVEDVRIGGKPFDRMAAVLDQMEAALAAGPVTLALDRAGERLTVGFTGVPACATRYQVKPSSKLNAAADGRYVEINAGFLGTFANEDELAAIVAHELAHNILGHRDLLDAQGVSRGLFGRFGKNAAKIRATEIEADRFSLILMRGAGYRMAAAAEFWQHFEKKHGNGVFADATHLNGRRRVDMLNAEIARVEAQ
jgi:hypothetical protein